DADARDGGAGRLRPRRLSDAGRDFPDARQSQRSRDRGRTRDREPAHPAPRGEAGDDQWRCNGAARWSGRGRRPSRPGRAGLQAVSEEPAMCFKNLPVEFDSSGRPFLRPGVADPYSPSQAPAGMPAQLTPEKIEELVRRNGHIKSVDFDPVARVAGALAFHTVADLKERRVAEARSVATLFRGYEVIMIGRDPRDAIYITSRACGVCGGVHSTCSALAIEMASGVCPPPPGGLAGNLAPAL